MADVSPDRSCSQVNVESSPCASARGGGLVSAEVVTACRAPCQSESLPLKESVKNLDIEPDDSKAIMNGDARAKSDEDHLTETTDLLAPPCNDVKNSTNTSLVADTAAAAADSLLSSSATDSVAAVSALKRSSIACSLAMDAEQETSIPIVVCPAALSGLDPTEACQVIASQSIITALKYNTSEASSHSTTSPDKIDAAALAFESEACTTDDKAARSAPAVVSGKGSNLSLSTVSTIESDFDIDGCSAEIESQVSTTKINTSAMSCSVIAFSCGEPLRHKADASGDSSPPLPGDFPSASQLSVVPLNAQADTGVVGSAVSFAEIVNASTFSENVRNDVDVVEQIFDVERVHCDSEQGKAASETAGVNKHSEVVSRNPADHCVSAVGVDSSSVSGAMKELALVDDKPASVDTSKCDLATSVEGELANIDITPMDVCVDSAAVDLVSVNVSLKPTAADVSIGPADMCIEAASVGKESANVGNESANGGNELANGGNESTNVCNESVKVDNESARVGSESTNIGNELVNVDSESACIGNEPACVGNEAADIYHDQTIVGSESTYVGIALASEPANVTSEPVGASSEQARFGDESMDEGEQRVITNGMDSSVNGPLSGGVVGSGVVDGSGGVDGSGESGVAALVAPLEDSLPADQLHAQLKAQLEYYFSLENLSRDTYMRSQMDDDQYVPIAVVAQFNLVRQLTHSTALVTDTLREIAGVQVTDSGLRVRRVSQRCTLILREIADSTPLEDVRGLFAGPVCPPVVSCEFAGNGSWYVTFESEDEAHRAYRYLREDVQTFQDKPIMARIKTKPPLGASVYMASRDKAVARSGAHFVAPPASLTVAAASVAMPPELCMGAAMAAMPFPLQQYGGREAAGGVTAVSYVAATPQSFPFFPPPQFVSPMWPPYFIDPSAMQSVCFTDAYTAHMAAFQKMDGAGGAGQHFSPGGAAPQSDRHRRVPRGGVHSAGGAGGGQFSGEFRNQDSARPPYSRGNGGAPPYDRFQRGASESSAEGGYERPHHPPGGSSRGQSYGGGHHETHRPPPRFARQQQMTQFDGGSSRRDTNVPFSNGRSAELKVATAVITTAASANQSLLSTSPSSHRSAARPGGQSEACNGGGASRGGTSSSRRPERPVGERNGGASREPIGARRGGYRGRRRNFPEDGPNSRQSESLPGAVKPKNSENFRLEATSFPPLPGAPTSVPIATSSAALENKMADVVKALARDAPLGGRWAMPARPTTGATADCQDNGASSRRDEGTTGDPGSISAPEGGSGNFRGSGRGGRTGGNFGRGGGVGAGTGRLDGAAENGANARLNGWESAGPAENGVSISPLARKVSRGTSTDHPTASTNSLGAQTGEAATERHSDPTDTDNFESVTPPGGASARLSYAQMAQRHREQATNQTQPLHADSSPLALEVPPS